VTAGPGWSGGSGVRRVVVIAAGLGGTGLLGVSLSTRPGSRQFYLLTLGLAGVWAAGAAASGELTAGGRAPAHGASARSRRMARDAAEAVLAGAATFAAFYGAARLARHIPPLDRAVRGVLRYAHVGSTPLVLATASVNGVAEELFFRGALWTLAEDARPLAATTLAYAAATTATRNPALVLAGAATSVVFGLQRRRSGGALAPAISHLTWSLLMLRYLPPLFRSAVPPAERPR
jgi:membrane protease YdiL (CAAX protease family)